MRESLTALAILLIVVLTTALVGPYFVDWNAHRAAIEDRLSAFAGVPVTVRGPIDLKLLPKPVFRLGAVAIGGRAGPYGTIPGGAGAPPSLAADEVDAELSLPALLRGQVQFVETTLEAPHLELTQGADGAIVLPHLEPGEADRVSLDHVGVRNGSVALHLTDGRRIALDGIDLDGEATTLRGPFKAHGGIGGIPLRVATGALDGGRMRVKLGIDSGEDRPALDLDGTLTLGGAPFAFAGRLSAAGALRLRDTPATVPWRATAEARADATGASLGDLEVRAGDDLRALIVDGTGMIARGAAGDGAAEITLKLHGAGLDLDSLAVAPKDGGIAPPEGASLIGLILEAAAGRRPDADLRLRLAVDADVDTVTLAGRTLLGATLHLGLGEQAGVAVAVSTTGPGGARLMLDGQVAAGPAFRGRVDAAVSDLPRFAAWLKPIAPDAAAWLAADVPAHAVAIAGDAEASAERIAASAATVRLDDARLQGSLALTRASDAHRPRLAADLATDRLELDAWPDLAMVGAPDLDLDIALSAPAVRLSGAAVGGAGTPVSGGPLAIHLTRAGDDLDLDRFSLALAGGSITATASRTGSEARAEARLDAPALEPIAQMLERLVPGPASAALAARATALSPASGTVRAEATVGPGGALVPARFAFDGTAGGIRLDASLTPDRDGPDAWSRPAALALDASTPEAAAFARLLGFAADTPVGPGTLKATAHGTPSAGYAIDAEAKLGETVLTYKGRAEMGRAQGRLSLATPDLRLLLADLGTASVPGSGTVAADIGADLDWAGARLALDRISARVAGTAASGDLSFGSAMGGGAAHLEGSLALDRLPAASLVALGLGAPVAAKGAPEGAWSSAPFGAAPVLPIGDVRLAIAEVPLVGTLVAHDAVLTLRIARTGITLADISARLAGGTVQGRSDLGRDGPSATLAGHFTWQDVSFALGDLSGRANGRIDIGGTAANPAALVGSLGGTGDLDLAAAVLARADPDAVARTAAAFTVKDPLADPDPELLDGAAIRSRLTDELGRGALALARQQVPVVVANGIARVAALKPAGGGSGAIDVALGLADLGFSLRARVPAGDTAAKASVGPGEVTIAETGTIGEAPNRQVDAAALVDRLRAQAVARAQERIDVIEQDIRERAYFNRQLKAIQADQAAARARADAQAAAAKAAADARQAEAARVKAEEEARVQQEFEAAARAAAARDAAARAEAEKQRFIDRQLEGAVGIAPQPSGRGRHPRPQEMPDLVAPPSIVDESPHPAGRL